MAMFFFILAKFNPPENQNLTILLEPVPRLLKVVENPDANPG
jgi:hypothetical protein